MAGSKRPEAVELSETEYQRILSEVEASNLAEPTKKIVTNGLKFMVWLQGSLAHANVTISILKKVFGLPGRSRSSRQKRNKDKAAGSSDNDNVPDVGSDNQENPVSAIAANDSNDDAETDSKPLSRANGRLTSASYQDKTTYYVKHQSLSAGMACPELCGGKLYELAKTPGSVIRIKGRSEMLVEHYQLQKLRCHTCGITITADLPDSAGTDKYDERFKAQVVLRKFLVGTPYYATERYQQVLGMPLSDAQQCELVEQVADSVYPVVDKLSHLLAHVEEVSYDDTRLKVLSHTAELKTNPDAKRKGAFTTVVSGRHQNHLIVLYRNGIQHAGENIGDILDLRDSALPPIRTMTDALAANLNPKFKVIALSCLAHGIRKFIDIEHAFASQCQVVIEALNKVYNHEDNTKSLNPEERLRYHQEHSLPIMDKLKVWLQAQLDNKLAEPNSHLGKAIKYLLKRWDKFTGFCHIAGASIDNNISERLLKLAIRVRKTSMFYKTEHSAYVAGILQSLIQTCIENEVNPLEYLIACQQHKSQIFKEPECWLPWNYTDNLISLQAAA